MRIMATEFEEGNETQNMQNIQRVPLNAKTTNNDAIETPLTRSTLQRICEISHRRLDK